MVIFSTHTRIYVIYFCHRHKATSAVPVGNVWRGMLGEGSSDVVIVRVRPRQCTYYLLCGVNCGIATTATALNPSSCSLTLGSIFGISKGVLGQYSWEGKEKGVLTLLIIYQSFIHSNLFASSSSPRSQHRGLALLIDIPVVPLSRF